MQLCKTQLTDGGVVIGAVDGNEVRLLRTDDAPSAPALSDILHASNPTSKLADVLDAKSPRYALRDVTLTAPIDLQEVWGAGVTYERSQVARREESQGGGSFYDKVYGADRPELFFKA